ncbi:hypothetical protein L9F63_012457 [Diploptera punctata]|uniref:Uncharacterized protein n=1 Tax=Diploptera punctata TaxID=6984 RepID=A0AAD8EMT2_DIPPU|nr:hypothetical protein L9F63_012457 [Diploptera punctata]
MSYENFRDLLVKGDLTQLQSLVNDSEDMVMLSADSKFIWERLREEHMPAVLDIMKKSVYENEGICKILDLNKRIISKKHTDSLIIDIAKAGCSLVAVEIETEKVVGISMNIMQTTEGAEIFDFFDVQWAMYVVYFATHPDYLNQGIGTGTLKANFELASLFFNGEADIISFDGSRSDGPTVEALVGVFTTKASHKIAVTLNWEEIQEFYYINLLENHKKYINVNKELKRVMILPFVWA